MAENTGFRDGPSTAETDRHITEAGQGLSGGHDRVRRADASLGVRLFGRHAISVAYRSARRTAFVTGLPTATQRSHTVGLFYTLLGSGGFGAIR